MALPSKLQRLVEGIVTQSEIERRLLRVLLRKLESSLAALNTVSGSDCAERCFRHLIKCLFQERSSGCLDQYEQWVERCLASRLGRALNDAEDELLGELLNQITGITETLVKLSGMELADEPDEDESGGAIGGAAPVV